MNQLNFEASTPKEEVFKQVESYLGSLSLKIADIDDQRPWGGFFAIDSSTTGLFIASYFPELDSDEIYKYGRDISPKILLVQPGQPLSWQYHLRRAEIWKVLKGPVGVVTSKNDDLGTVQALQTGDTIQHEPKDRHRLVGLDSWGVVAEIWQHNDQKQLSDEEDIVRLEDNYGRS